jgi:two-component system cell cycle response regulator DivK
MTPHHVLVIEDNEMNADVLRENLLDAGYTLALAVNGAAGVAMANDLLPDIILMDVNLPILDGLSATRLLKRNTSTQGIPIVALTARAMTGDREICLQAGCDDYVSKPVDMEVLLAKMRHHLDKRPRPFVEMLRRKRSVPDNVFPLPARIEPDTSALQAQLEKTEAELQIAERRLWELDETLTGRDRELAHARAERDAAHQEVARLAEELARLRTAPAPHLAPAPLVDPSAHTLELARQLALAEEHIAILQQQLEAGPGELRALQAQNEGLRRAFVQLHRSVCKAAEEAMHEVAFGRGPTGA